MSFIAKFPRVEVKQYNSQNEATGVGIGFDRLFHTLTVVKILRSYECSWSRLEAMELNRYKACLDKMGVGMVALAGEESDAKQYVKGGSWDGEFYIDESRAFCRSKRPLNALRSELSRLAQNLSKSPPKSNFQDGGTYIVAPDLRVVYLHHPRALNDVPDTGLILFICRSWAYALKETPLTRDIVQDNSSVSDGSLPTTPDRRSGTPQSIWNKAQQTLTSHNVSTIV
ncbi:hypothetical protein DSO57_1027172 [Entomophthora muscae]|uniref:Uncharacterized protein n=1 Tax=Entomophthora muscae TaxID=34485 RepID=A0ACC2SEN3_9FUNG|nr:hypothetical protein DSO57_1027172 [Entomophthora muscae]